MILFYDTETTGTDPRKHSIIQLSGIIDSGGTELERFDFRVRPHLKAQIESAALAANGHDELEIWGYPEMREVMAQFTGLLRKHVDPYDPKNKMHLCGYNNRGFDDDFLRTMFLLCSYKSFGGYFWSDSIDLLPIASNILREVRHTMPSFKLHRVARTFGIEVDQDKLHDSMYDVEITRKLYYILGRHTAQDWTTLI